MSLILSYVLDTNWVIEYRARREPYVGRIRQLGVARLGVSTATIAELYEGAYFSRAREESLSRLEEFLSDDILILPLTHAIALEVGKERGRLRRLGMVVGDFDVVIGCTALHYRVPLCTNNVRHFERIEGLEIIAIP